MKNDVIAVGPYLCGIVCNTVLLHSVQKVAFSLLLIPGCECGAMLSYVIDIQGQTQDSHKPQNESIIKAKNTLTDEVTLDKLSLMKLPNEERVKIIETLAKDWRIVGSQLNFDRAGNQLDIIEKQKLKDPVACCEAMLQHWLNEWEWSETHYMEDTNRHSERLRVYLAG